MSINVENFVYNVLNKYFLHLSVFGYRKDNSVKKIITLLAIYDLVSEDYRGYLKREDYVYIERALECLLGSDCLIPNLNSCGINYLNKLHLGDITELNKRIKDLEDALIVCANGNIPIDDIPLIYNFSLNIDEVYGEQTLEINRVSFDIKNIHYVRPNSLSIIDLNNNTTIAENLSINSYLDIPYKVTIKPDITYSWKATVEGIDGNIYESNIYTIVPKKPVVNTMYYGNTNIDPRLFQSMGINSIFNIPNMVSKDIIGDNNITFTINQTSTLHYLIIPEEKMTLVKAEYGSLLVTTLWNGSPEESAYFITNEGGVFNGVKYRVFFSYSPIGAFSEDIRITVKNKI